MDIQKVYQPNEIDSQLVLGKRCIVVAPSGYLKGRGQASGHFVESFDIVVKCTRTIDIADPSNELGGRCDLWYGLPHYPKIPWSLDAAIVKQQDVKHLYFQPRLQKYAKIWDSYMAHFFARELSQTISWSESSAELYQNLIDRFGCIPFTGVFAIYHLLAAGAKEVFAYGHDFYLSGYFNDVASTRCDDSDWHALTPQMEYLWELLNHEPRFKCDPNLVQLLSEKFGSNEQLADSKSNLLCADINHFFSHSDDRILVFRSCNIRVFQNIMDDLKTRLPNRSLHILAQKEVVNELNDSAYYTIEYPENTPFDFGVAQSISALNDAGFTSCLIPYNGLELLTYLQLFKIADWLRVEQVFMISPRGALSKIDDLNTTIFSIERYLSLRQEFKVLEDKFDRRNCL